MKVAKPYPHLYKDKDRQGEVRWRLRAPGRKTATIKGDFGSPEFAANYRAALEGTPTPVGTIPTKTGTMVALARSYLRSAAFAALSPATARTSTPDRELHHRKVGHSARGWTPTSPRQEDHGSSGRDTWHGAQRLIHAPHSYDSSCRGRAQERRSYSCGQEPKLSKDGWHTWTEAEIAQYEAHHSIGTMARLAFALALHTGQRSSDLIRMGKQHVSGGKIAVKQQKTGTSLKVPLHRELKAIIEATPSGHMTFLVSEVGKPFRNANSFGHRMRLWSRLAGLIGCPLHGLRKACCRRLAEAGCTASQIMAISGHKSMAEAERYCRDAEQERMADRAISRTETYPRLAQSYPREA
jgi:integrase